MRSCSWGDKVAKPLLDGSSIWRSVSIRAGYLSGVDVSSSILRFRAEQLRRYRRAISSRRRRLTLAARPSSHSPTYARDTRICPARRRVRSWDHDRTPLRHRGRRPPGRPRTHLGRSDDGKGSLPHRLGCADAEFARGGLHLGPLGLAARAHLGDHAHCTTPQLSGIRGVS